MRRARFATWVRSTLRHTVNGAGGVVSFDFEKLGRTVRTAVRQLDAVIDLNYYPLASAKASNLRWRPVGLGLMGLQDVFFQMRLPFDAPEARDPVEAISEEVYFHALMRLGRPRGREGAPSGLRGDAGRAGRAAVRRLGRHARRPGALESLRAHIAKYGLRNSLLCAIAPTATIASIAGCCECIEPQVSNLFKRETLSGDFLQINRYLVTELKALGLWNEAMRSRLKLSEDSAQELVELPEASRAVVPHGLGDSDALAH